MDKLVDSDPNSDNLVTDAKMMNLLKDIANKMIKMITWEEDITDSYEDGKLPVLDLKMFLDKKDFESEEPLKFEFYQKQIANKRVIYASSAMPRSVKFSTLVEELNRRLRNTPGSLLEERKVGLVAEFNARMAEAGHTETFRLKVTESSLNKFEKFTKEAEEKGKKVHRSKKENLEHRRKIKGKKSKTGWYRQIGYNVTLKIQNTPGGPC